MILIEFLGSFQIRAESFVTYLQTRYQTKTDGVVNLVAEHGTANRQNYQPSDVEISSRCKYPGCYQQRISRQKKTEKQPCLHENYRCDAYNSAPLNQRCRIQVGLY